MRWLSTHIAAAGIYARESAGRWMRASVSAPPLRLGKRNVIPGSAGSGDPVDIVAALQETPQKGHKMHRSRYSAFREAALPHNAPKRFQATPRCSYSDRSTVVPSMRDHNATRDLWAEVQELGPEALGTGLAQEDNEAEVGSKWKDFAVPNGVFDNAEDSNHLLEMPAAKRLPRTPGKGAELDDEVGRFLASNRTIANDAEWSRFHEGLFRLAARFRFNAMHDLYARLAADARFAHRLRRIAYGRLFSLCEDKAHYCNTLLRLFLQTQRAGVSLPAYALTPIIRASCLLELRFLRVAPIQHHAGDVAQQHSSAISRSGAADERLLRSQSQGSSEMAPLAAHNCEKGGHQQPAQGWQSVTIVRPAESAEGLGQEPGHLAVAEWPVVKLLLGKAEAQAHTGNDLHGAGHLTVTARRTKEEQGLWISLALEIASAMKGRGLEVGSVAYKLLAITLSACERPVDAEHVLRWGLYTEQTPNWLLYWLEDDRYVNLVPEAGQVVEVERAAKGGMWKKLVLLAQAAHGHSFPAAIAWSITFSCLGKEGKLQTAFSILQEFRRPERMDTVLWWSKLRSSRMCTSFVQSFAPEHGLDASWQFLLDVEQVIKVPLRADSFTVLIQHACEQGDINRALLFLEEAQKLSQLTEEAFRPVILELMRSEYINEAFALWEAMKRCQIRPGTPAYNSLINGCLINGLVNEALELLEKMKADGIKRDSHTYTPFIRKYLYDLDTAKARSMLQLMEADRIAPHPWLYVFFIQSCTQRGLKEEGLQVLEEMKARGITPNAAVWSAVVELLYRSNDFEALKQIYVDLDQKELLTNRMVADQLLEGLVVGGYLGKAIELLQRCRRDGSLPSHMPINRLLDALGGRGDLDALIQVFEETKDPKQFPRKPREDLREELNHRAITALLACSRAKNLQAAIILLQRLMTDGFADTRAIFDRLMLHISKGGVEAADSHNPWLTVRDGLRVIHTMREAGLPPTRLSLECLLDACAASGAGSGAARNIMAEMRAEGLEPNILTHIRVFKAAVTVEDTELALDALRQMDPSDLVARPMRRLLNQILEPHWAAAARGGCEDAPETLPRVRAALHALMSDAAEIPMGWEVEGGESGDTEGA